MKYTTLATVLPAVLSVAMAAPANVPTLEERGLFDFILPASLTGNPDYGAPANDFNCKSDRNPVVILHGMLANRDTPVNLLHRDLQASGWCTFALTYGAHTLVPWVGGVKAMRDTAKDIASFIKEVHDKTGKKVDLVGHSEGGVMSLYVPLTQAGISDIVERTVALGPAVHGARYYGFADFWYIGGQKTRDFVGNVLSVLGCPACDDMAPDGKVFNDFKANEGKIVQSAKGIKSTIITSSFDTLVPAAASNVLEPGVRNLLIQDYCADDNVGHAGLASDRNIWQVIKNELNEKYDAKVDVCNYENINPN